MTLLRVFVVAASVLCGAGGVGAQEPAGPHPPEPVQSAPPPASAEDHSSHSTAAAPLPAFIPPLTEADRQAAFPDMQGHTVHDNAVNYFVLFDQFEGQVGDGQDGFSWDTKGWVGQDRNRLWFRTEGDRLGGRLEQAQSNVLYGRAFSRWWDATAGFRFDTLPDTPRTAVAVGVQGLAPSEAVW